MDDREREHLLNTIEEIAERADEGIQLYKRGRHLGVTGITALTAIRTKSRDALDRLDRVDEEGAA